MSSEPSPGPAAPDTESTTIVSPVVVVTRAFRARPSSLPDAQDFVRDALSGVQIDQADARSISTAINEAILAAASPDIGTFQIVVRLFPDEAEVEVLCAAPEDASLKSLPSRVAADASFAEWLTDVLRRDGLSQEAAARQLGVSVRTVGRWLRGQTEPRLRDLRRIQEVFGHAPLS